MQVNDIEDYEAEFDMEEAGWLDEEEEHDPFDEAYEAIFDAEDDVSEDVEQAYERDAVTGQKASQPKIAKLNQSKVSQRELDELFLQH